MAGSFLTTGNTKWIMLAAGLSLLAIIVMLIGLYRNNKIAKLPTDIPEEEAGNQLAAKKVFIKHAVIAAVLIIIAVIIRFTLGGTPA